MSRHSGSLRLALASLAVVVAFGALAAWLGDAITLQGERTIYTVDCADGQWAGDRCTGSLRPAARFRFRALRARGEVLFWRVGVAEPSARLEACTIRDGRNWQCPPGRDAARSITLEMDRGCAVRDATSPTLAFRSVPKWRWLLLRWGLPAGSTASDGARAPD